MENFTFKIRIKILLSFILSSLFMNVYGGEGTKQTTPDVNHRASLCINNNEYGNFARYGSTNEQRLYIRIQNPNSEKVYLGFSKARRSAPDNNNSEVDSKFRILDPNGNVVFGSYNLTTSSSNITGTEAQKLSRAQNGPNGINGITTTGYVPIVFDPTGMPAGDYYIEFETNNNSYTELYYNYYDITVANNATKNSISGRLYSKRWALAMDNVTTDFNGAFFVFAPDNGSTTGAITQTGFVNKINFNGAGFRPWYFNVAFNNTGAGSTGNTANDQKSVWNAANATKMSPKYEVFLNDPDINVWKNGTYNGNIQINGITNCGIGESNINISVFKSGTIDILLDFNNGDGIYTPGTKDVLTTQSVTGSGAPPYAVSVPWNGKDGLGNTIAQGTSIPIVVSFGQAAFHFPMYDIEENQNGFSCTTVRPAAPSGYILKLYWDDSNITYTGGVFSSKLNLTGCTPNNVPPGNCHTWNNFNSNNNGSPQYGNLNTINTWWYANRDFVTSNITLPPFYTVALGPKTNVTCFGGNDGKIQVNVTNGTAPFTYYINGEITPNTLQALVAGTYNIKVVDANGCSANINGVVITQPTAALALAASSKTDVICYGKSTGSVNAGAISNLIGTITYSWKNALNVSVGTTASVTNLPAGTYTLTVTDNCSTQTNSVIIGQPTAALALAASSKTDVTCFGFSTGTVTAGAVTNFVGTVTYNWKNASNVSVGTTASVSNLPAGTYTLTVTDNCSTQTNSVVIGQPSAALALAASSKTDVTCFGFSTGSVTAGLVTNSVGTVNYVWKNALNVSVGTTASVSNLPAGTYTLTVTDNCSTQTNSVIIGQPSAALALAASSKTDVTCFGLSTGSVTAGLVTNSVGTVNYVWKNSSNVSVGTTASVSNLPAGTYTLTVTDNCSSQTNSVIIGQPSAALALAASSKTDVTCFGFSTGTVTAGLVTNSVGTVNYVWKNALNVSVGTTASVSNLPAGTYTLTVTDNCSSQTNSVIIGQPIAALALAASSKTDVTCFGFSTGTVTAGAVTNSVGTVNYVWKNASNVSVGTTASVSNLPAGTYTLTVTDNCSTQTNSVIIGQPSAALALAASSKTDVTCFGFSTGSVTAGAVTNNVGTVNYVWKNALNVSVGTTASVSNLPAGTYTLTVTDNCSTQTNSVIIGQPTAALALAASSKTDVTCFGFSTGSVTAGAVTNNVGTVNYVWKNSSNVSVGSTASVSNLPAGTYTLTVTDNCSTQTNSVIIGQPTAALALAASSKTDVTCFGFSTGTVTAGAVTNFVGTVTYNWKNALNVSVGTTASVSNLPAGTYTLTVTDNCSTQTNSVIIGQPTAALALAASSKTDVTCFGFSTGSVTAGLVTNSVGTVTYNWKNALNVSVGTTASVSNLPAGTYTLTVTDNCSTQTNSVIIGQPSAALALAASSKTDVTCFGFSTGSVTAGSVTNNVGTVNYVWKNASNVSVGSTASVSNLPAGAYTLTVTDNCSTQTNSVIIGQPTAALALAASSKTDVTCFGFSTGSITAGTVTNNVGTVNYVWKNASNVSVGTTASVSNLPAGTYTLTVTDNCSTQTNSVVIGQPTAALALAASSKTDVTCFGFSTGSVTAGLVTNSVGTVNYVWKNALNVSVGTTASVSNLPAGTYTLTVTDNCSTQTNSVIIGQPSAALSATTSQINVGCGGGNNGSASVNVSGGTLGYTYSWNTTPVQTSATATGLIAGTYTVTIKDANLCTISKSVTITDGDAVKPIIDPLPLASTINCPALPVFATATATDNNGTVSSLTYDDVVIQGSCAGSYTTTRTWTAVDACGNISLPVSQVINVQDITAPTWSTTVASLNKTIECSDAAALTSAQALFPIASDLCDSDVSDIVKVSGAFIASTDCSNAGTYTNTWTVKDDCGNTSDNFTQVITIEDTSAPTWSTAVASLNKTIECSDAAALTSAQTLFPIASDLCDSDVSDIVKVSGAFVASADCSNAGTYTNIWTVKDDCGNTSETFTQVITIQDTSAPIWSTTVTSLNKTIECSDATALTSAQALFPIASDLCDSDVSDIVKVSGAFVASADCSNAGTYTNTWTVKDDCGNTSNTFTQVITIQDTTKPTFIGELPTDITVSCDAVPEPANVEATDNCNGNLPVVFSEIKSDIVNSCSTNYTLTRTWATSDCGLNTASYTQIITVRDTTPPTGTAPVDVANLQTITDIPVGNPGDIKDAADNCSSTVDITVSDSNNGGSGCDGNAYILTRTYTLTDCAGNKTELKQTFTVENKVSVTGVVSNVTCFGGKDGLILVTNSPGSTVVIRNENNEVVGNTNLPAGTYTLTATSSVNSGSENCSATATVVISQPTYTVKISGQIINKDTNTPIANVPVTLVPQGTTAGPILLRITGADGLYNFSGMVAGSYLVQVQDANLNSAHQLYPIDSSLFFTTLEDCKIQEHNFEYGKSTLPVLGDYVWYDTNGNGVQDEWYDANNDGIVTKNIPDGNGAIDYSQWEWIDLNGDGSYAGPSNVGELNAGGFGNALSANVIIDGPNGYHQEVIVGIEGFWRNRPDSANPYGDYTIKLVKDANLDAVAAALGASGLVKVLPSITDKKATNKTGKSQLHTVCSTTNGASGYIVTITPEDLVHLDADFGVNCKVFSDIVANDDSAGPIAGVNHITKNVLNVLPNDTLEGIVVTASDVIITTVTPNEFLQLNSDGSVDVLANAPVGTLTLVYQICEADQTTNCDTATVTVTIEAPVMTVTATPICVNDVPYIDYVVTPVNFTPVNGVTIAWANSNNTVITTMNDLPLTGRVLWPGAVVDQTGKGIDWPGWVFQDNKWIEAPDGFETLRPLAKLTISTNPSETITVEYPKSEPYCTARPTFVIVANDDNAGPINGTTASINVINVYNNDTLNAAALNPADVTLTIVTPDSKGALTLNPDGSVDVAAGTPGGTYTLTYQICENADAGNCDTAIVTVIVSEPAAPPTPVIANDDVYTKIGCNTFGLVGNVLINDFKGIARASLELVNFTLLNSNNNAKTDPNISFDALGNVTVSSLTPAGTYTYNYQICDKLSADNCDTATVTITVVPNGIVNISSQACNDDSTLVDLLALLPENTPLTGVWIDPNNSNTIQGNTFNALGLALGNYTFEYKITDQNCPRSILLNMEINDDCKVLACGNVVVHNAFSPNGDGINDVFRIDSINDTTCYPENNVEIYNRWGILVFETDNYNNTTNAFDGISRGRTTVKQSDGLPTGTYFYIINYKSLDGNNVLQNNKKDGYLYLSK